MRTAIITGIDGCGKSTLVKRLHDEYAGDASIGLFACPSYHHLAGSGHEQLSILFERLNELGNAWRLSDLKALALYLQMSLYRPVLEKVATRPNCELVVSERHALIDTVVYGSLYANRITGMIDQQTWEPLITQELDQLYPYGFETVQQWVGYLNEVAGTNYHFWNYTGFLKDVFTASPATVMRQLSGFFQLQLPDQVCFLQIEPDEALTRLDKRDKQRELHERKDLLEALQSGYLHLLQALKKEYPQLQVSILHSSDYQLVKETLHLNPVLIPS